MKRGLGACIAAAALSLAIASGADAKQPVTISCGETITADTKLANNLIDCPRHGIIIGADDITLDLNGHTIDGDATPFEPCPADEPCDVGVVNTAIRDGTPFNGPGYDGVTIKNGSIREFAEVGVYVYEASDNRMRRLKTSSSEFESDGIHLTGCTHCRIEQSSASDYAVGFVVFRSHDVRVDRNVVNDNRFAGVLLARSTQINVSANTVTGHADGEGIVLIDSDNSRVERNETSGNVVGVGVLEGSAGNTVIRNDAIGNAFAGVVLDGSRENVVSNNLLRGNEVAGVAVIGSDENRIERNSVIANGDGSSGGIHLFVPPDAPDLSANDNLISKNLVVANIGDGVLVDAGQSGNVIEGNRANENTDDGVDVDSSATTLTANAANDNFDLGIEAVSGVIDAGGNRASGNGNPLQCTNVFCG